MSTEEMTFVLLGQPRIKKNSQQIMIGKNGSRFIAQSQLYKDFETDCLWQLKTVKSKLPGPPPYNVKCIYYRNDRRKCDLTNLEEATDDILVKAGVLEDDNFTVIGGHDGSRVKYDKNNPRTEITITCLSE